MSFAMILAPPGPEAKALAEKELRETEENVKKGIETLRKLLEGWWTYYFLQFNPEVCNTYLSVPISNLWNFLISLSFYYQIPDCTSKKLNNILYYVLFLKKKKKRKNTRPSLQICLCENVFDRIFKFFYLLIISFLLF